MPLFQAAKLALVLKALQYAVLPDTLGLQLAAHTSGLARLPGLCLLLPAMSCHAMEARLGSSKTCFEQTRHS